MILCQSLFNLEYPGIKICQSGNLQDFNLHDSETRRRDINYLISNNCTHLQGSLYIRGLKNMKGESILLDSLREIDGHLIIENNDIESISFKNLLIIRGHVSKTHTLIDVNHLVNISFQVTGNILLKSLILTNLRSVTNHDVLFDNNPLLQYLPHKIKWNELFSQPTVQRLFSSKTSADILSRDVCHSSCEIWPKRNTSFCWGPLQTQCQIKTLCESLAEECETCIYKNGKEINCCDHLCVGGCHKVGPENCMACKQMLNGKRCVEACPSKFKGGIAGSVTNHAFKYYSGSFCSTKCPDNMLPEDVACVHSCTQGYFKNKTNHCVKCSEDTCQKEDIPCNMMDMDIKDERDIVLSANVLKKLTNCSKIRGYIAITKETFSKNNVTVKMLYDHLSNVEEIEGGFNYYMDDHLTNLTFLAKLKTFRAANLHAYLQGFASFNKFAISSTNLQFLGLKSLKKIKGNFYIYENKKLCFFDLPWKEIVDGKYKIIPKKCPNEECDSECSSKGCWMTGSKWCFECKHFTAGKQCVSNCSIPRGYFLSNISSDKNNTCEKCDSECAITCNGTSGRDCTGGCVNKEEKGICVSNCSFTSYATIGSRRCLPCSTQCTKLSSSPQCSGPSNKPGKGGCNKCSHILIEYESVPASIERIKHCVTECPEKTFARVTTNEEIIKYFLNIGYVCEPCHSLCTKCAGRRSHREDCITCTGFWNNDVCLKKCPRESTYGYNSSQYCLQCNKACFGGCTGPTEFDCNKCRDRKIYINGTNFYCNKTCPSHKNVDEREEKTDERVCLNVWESRIKKEEIKRNKIIICAILIMLTFVIIIIALIVIFLRRKASKDRFEADLNARYSNLTEPNSKNDNGFCQPPNMGRLAIISKEDLIFEDETKPLGYGAFGYVYRGKWKIPKEDDMLIRKSTGEFFLPVAIKVIKTIGPTETDAIMQEAKIMASVSHMHCLRFIGVCLSYEKPCIVTAFVKDGSLDKFLVRNRDKITSFIMLSWGEQIADGMLYLTKRGIIHRDLAARNVLVSRLECVQITDFGLSKMLENTNEREIVIKSGKVPIRWLAIETLLEGKYSFETDVWAYGVTLWEIFTFGRVPYEDQATMDIFDFVMKGGRLSQPDICSLDVYIVMVNCWLESPNLRPDFEGLMKTFIDYSKNPGRYLSIEGDPFEIPSPNKIEMKNLNNIYGDQFNFSPGTAETMLPLLNGRDSIDLFRNDLISDSNFSTNEGDESSDFQSQSHENDLPTRTENKTNNLFKRFHEKSQSNNSQTNINHTSKLIPLFSLEEPTSKGQTIKDSPLVENPRYDVDPIQLRQNGHNLRSQFPETPRFHSNPLLKKMSEVDYNLPPPPKAPNIIEDKDEYLEPVKSPNSSHLSPLNNNNSDYLEPVALRKKISIEEDEYVTPSYSNSPMTSLLHTDNNNKSPMFGHKSKMSNNSVDDEYLEPQSEVSPLKPFSAGSVTFTKY